MPDQRPKQRRKPVIVPLLAAKWEVIDGGVGLCIDSGDYVFRIKDAAAFRAFMLSAVDAACDAWPEIAEDFELNHGDPVPE